MSYGRKEGKEGGQERGKEKTQKGKRRKGEGSVLVRLGWVAITSGHCLMVQQNRTLFLCQTLHDGSRSARVETWLPVVTFQGPKLTTALPSLKCSSQSWSEVSDQLDRWKKIGDRSQDWNCEISLLLTFHWPEMSHKITSNCKECWEMKSTCVPRKKSKWALFKCWFSLPQERGKELVWF